MCLPGSIVVSTKPRPAVTAEYGRDINLPFLRAGKFSPEILDVRKDAEDVIVLRTGSSGVYFVETKHKGWMVYAYGDVPIE
jgi:hypothetical protein